jgi:hypothetical protein
MWQAEIPARLATQVKVWQRKLKKVKFKALL